ncbi:DUF397 domain-containing protein [Streptomyces griseofuscus]|uniref:DUF397 domain-containing protein n=1 Tax=Streptomyces griseofuscus TaxID=146922 RepID=A0A3R8RBZ9_9ACTN|nr:DUF397 domain-containing protein [Streptomyces griseofuscus]RRQ79461.1 DUF397 domain-containing protein [Streptomyces griseofuscus]RRQ85095.1 DUF397 domain-containing protein [Streptomyces griseofuscus]
MLSNEHTVSDASTLTGWFKSSYSGGTNDNCVEIASGHTVVPVRDSKDSRGPALLFSVDSWAAFVGAVKG